MTKREILILLALMSLISAIPLEMVLQQDFAGGILGIIDKAVKATMVGVLGLSLFGNRDGLVLIDRRRLLLFLAAATMALVYGVHVLVTPPGFDLTAARSEVFRLITYALVILFMGNASLSPTGLRFLLVLTSLFGAVAASFAVLHSYTGTAERSGYQVGDLLRAGTGLVDANVLGGFIVVAAIAALALSASASGYKRYLYFLVFAGCSVGRFWTFSSGSLIGEAIALVAFLFFYMRYIRAPKISHVSAVLTLMGIGFYYMYSTGLYETFFYRLMLSDDYVYHASIGSRMAQYEGAWHSVYKDPSLILSGVGAARVGYMNGTGFDFHNALLRPWVVGGVFAFIAYAFANWIVVHAIMCWIRQRTLASERVLGVGLLSAYCGWTVQSLTLPADTTTVQWFLICAIAALAFGRQVKTADNMRIAA